MSDTSLLDVPPPTLPELDPEFRPAYLANRSYAAAVGAAGEGGTARMSIALERNQGLIARRDLEVLAAGSPHDEATWRYVERQVKFLLWARGGWRLHVSGPPSIVERLRDEYRDGGRRGFDADLIGTKAFGRTMDVVECTPETVPEEKNSFARLGGHLDGCRIGFDLGASDYKLAAVVEGEPVFSTEIPWAPTDESDIEYHRSRIQSGLELAASKMPRVDAIGGSSAGIYIDNQVMVASLFRSLPPAMFESEAKPLFLKMRERWGVPFEVANDGDVTALAGAMSLGKNAMLGLAMGSSEAVGYLDPEGRITGWLNELAFAPVDMNPTSPADEWSRDNGVGAMHFSQQAVNKLAPRAGIEFDADLPLPERLKVVQERANAGDEGACKVFRSIGVYLGYTIPYYAEFYDYENLLILGRVTSGHGGELILETARELLSREFPEHAERISVHVPDERSRRVGQAVAAASLPEINAG